MIAKLLVCLLVGQASAGTFKLYDVANDVALVTLVDRGTYDLNILGVGADPQVTVLFENDNPGANSVVLKMSERSVTGDLTLQLTRECDRTEPFFATSGLGEPSDPVPFDFPLDDKVKIVARLAPLDDCQNVFAREKIVFTLVNTFQGTTPAPAPAPNTPSPAPTTPAPTPGTPTTPPPTSSTAPSA